MICKCFSYLSLQNHLQLCTFLPQTQDQTLCGWGTLPHCIAPSPGELAPFSTSGITMVSLYQGRLTTGTESTILSSEMQGGMLVKCLIGLGGAVNHTY